MQVRLLGKFLFTSLALISVSFGVTNSARSASDERDATSSVLAQASPCANGQESGLPLPSGFAPPNLPVFQMQLKSFLTSGRYRTLSWCEDKQLRDTGPFIN